MSWLGEEFPKVAEALVRFRCTADGRVKASCPNGGRHRRGDKDFSLLIKRGDHGGLVFKCMAGCTREEVLAAARLTWKDVSRDKPGFTGSDLAEKAAYMKKLIKRYEYRRPVEDGGGVEFEVLRYFPKDFRPRRAMPGHPGEYAYRLLEGRVKRVESRDLEADPTGFKWVEGSQHDTTLPLLKSVCPTLYNSDMISGTADKIILWCEGEKKADALCSFGFLATTVQGGANNRTWCPEWSRLVKGRIVILLPDNDTPGVEYAAWYSGCCQVAGASGVATVRLPGLKRKGDVADWLFANRQSEADKGPNSELAKSLRGVLAQADLYRPVKLYEAFGLAANPVKGHASPQAPMHPETAQVEVPVYQDEYAYAEGES